MKAENPSNPNIEFISLNIKFLFK